MSKIEPINIAKWFINQDIPGIDNSQAGNTKLQKLIFFSQLIYMCQNNEERMFDQEFSAFKNGMVLNDVRVQFKNHYAELKENSSNNVNIPKDIEDVLYLTKQIFGNYSSDELSKMSHEFEAWKIHYENSKILFGYNYSRAKVPYDELKQELYRMKKVLKAYETTSNMPYNEEEDY